MNYENKLTFGDYIGTLSQEDLEKRGHHFSLMDDAKRQRDQYYDEFDGMTVRQYTEKNAKTAASYQAPRQNPTDTKIVTGIPREKLLVLVSNIVRLNLTAEVLSFDKDNNEEVNLGRALAGLIRKSKEIEGDKLKQLQRIMYLFEQGTIFVEEAWNGYQQKVKDLGRNFKWTGKQKDLLTEYSEKIVTTYQCETQILDMLSVYLGNIRQFDIEKQPFVFTRVLMHYRDAEALYGQFDNWKYVRPGIQFRSQYQDDDSTPYRNYLIEDLQDHLVEVIKYQNKWDDEYQIYISGVGMLPYGFPMPWRFVGMYTEGKTYNISKSVNEIISPYFAYGKSMMSKISRKSDLLDEMLRQFVRKTKQTTNPPTSNQTGSILSSRIYDPGTMWTDIDPSKLNSLVDHNGVTASETAIWGQINDLVNNSTTSPTFAGQEAGGNPTATEILQMQRQAQISLGLSIFAVQVMEENVSWLRLQNILENWTKPIDVDIDDNLQELKYMYRDILIEDENIDGENGNLQVIFENEMPDLSTPDKVKEFYQKREEQSYRLLTDKMRASKALKKIFVNIALLRSLKYRYKLRVNSNERDSDNLNKVLFREEFGQAVEFFGQDVNMDAFKKKWAAVWGHSPDDVFMQRNTQDFTNALSQAAVQNPKQVIPQIKDAAMGESPQPAEQLETQAL